MNQDLRGNGVTIKGGDDEDDIEDETVDYEQHDDQDIKDEVDESDYIQDYYEDVTDRKK